ncbi:MAG: helix-turn-helix domain-containing protein [Candidatus Delongbacteria bacterium]|nr:helix-turn-helix domain-containing protein [Candidatus Delongbacteria bacterium]MBN2835795.1 helix-turn-helix domain-containing protein [Candidatus Delongbacteria bacterium]
MSENSRIRIEKRLKILSLAADLGVSQTAKMYDIDPKTIRNWRRKFEDSGRNALENQSKKHIEQKYKMPESEFNLIKECYLNNPNLSAREIKENLNLKYSLKTILKKLSEIKSDPNDLKYSLDEIRIPLLNNDFYLRISDLENKGFKNKIYKYLFILINSSTGAIFCSFASEKTDLNIALFIDYSVFWLKKNQFEPSFLNFHLDPSILKTKGFIKKVAEKNKIEIMTSRYSEDIFDFDNRKYIKIFINNLKSKDIKNNDDLLLFTHSLVVSSNTQVFSERLEKHNRSDISFFEKLENLSFSFVPIYIDKHFTRFSAILNNTQPWDDFLTEFNNFTAKSSTIFYQTCNDIRKVGDNKSALLFFGVAAKWLQIRNPELKILSLLQQCIILWNLERDEDAWRHLQNAYSQAVKLKHIPTLIKCYNLLSMHFYRKSDFERAFFYNKKELDLARKINDTKNIMRTTINMGVQLQIKGSYNTAIKLYNNLINTSNDNYNITFSYINLSLLYLNIGKPSLALKNSYLVLEYSNDHNYHNNDYHIYNSIGRSYLALDRFLEAKINFQKAAEISMASGLFREYYECQNFLAHISCETGNFKKALEILQEIQNNKKELNLEFLLAELNLIKSKILLRIGKDKNFKESIEEAKNKAINLNELDTLFEIKMLEGYFYLTKTKFNIAHEIYKEAKELCPKRFSEKLASVYKYIALADALIHISKSETSLSTIMEKIEIFFNMYNVKDRKRTSAEFNFRIWFIVKLLTEKGLITDISESLYKKYPAVDFSLDKLRLKAIRGYQKLFMQTQKIIYSERIEMLKSYN